jgi:hypothetical protein
MQTEVLRIPQTTGTVPASKILVRKPFGKPSLRRLKDVGYRIVEVGIGGVKY